MSETVTILELPRTKSSSDDSFTALMNAVLDSARSSASQGASTSPSSNASTSSSSTAIPIPTIAPPIAESVSTDSTNSSRSSSASASTSASASAPPSTSTSTNPSPCPSILRSSSSNLTLPSRTGSPNITFAPLPATEPRKRNSPHPLGVAARSRLLRHRRMLREHGLNPDDLPYQYGAGAGVMGGLGGAASLPDRVERPERPRPGREWDGPVEIREAQAGVDADEDAGAVGPGRRKARARAASDPDEGDARVSLGRLVKGAGKSLWRSISMKDVRAKEKEAHVGPAPAEPAEPSESQAEEQPPPPPVVAPVPRKTAIHLFDDPDTPAPHSDGGVWEEEVEEESWKKLLSKPPGAPTSQPQEMPDLACAPSKSASDALPKRTSKVEVLVARVR
ncbi:hypothetical protein BD413DRAFT_615129 [Trametes elegans]|nr:hypothetical protein BD413DRAFT_615129 [Trametes elegans]